jgi:hypothetical protein
MNENEPLMPPEYEAFEELVVCGNRFIKGKILVSIKNEVPLIVGRGRVPLVWLSIPASNDGKLWRSLVTMNSTKDEKIRISTDELKGVTEVTLQNVNIIQVIKLSEEKAEITNLNLKPFGIAIFGDRNGLYVGTNRLSNNTFNNVHTLINFA